MVCHINKEQRKTAISNKILLTLGNGNLINGFTILNAIARRLTEAREKHPVFAEGAPHALGVIGSEYEEFRYAVEHESEERQDDEALDVVATALRFLAGEHKNIKSKV